MIRKKIIDKFLQTLQQLRHGSLQVTTPDGREYRFQGHSSTEPSASFCINNSQVISHLAAKGDIGFAESYRDGHFETDNLANLLIIALKNAEELETYVYGDCFTNLMAQIFYLFNRNTLRGSRRNIQAHYDLGNDFYALWLDKTMTYSSAMFTQPQQSLAAAQAAKYNRILEKISLQQADILEIGCGWGGFAEQALKAHDFQFTGLTLSKQQQAFAERRLGKSATIKLADYRQQQGQYHSIVSIEMLEAVGEKYWPVYFKKIKALLKKQGSALIQSIVINDLYFQRYRKTGDMIRRFIFPGGMLPSVERLNHTINAAGLHIHDTFKFGQDYELTLNLWLASFEKNLDAIKAMHFDEKFIRIWRFYLSVCIAGFHVGRTDVVQLTLTHNGG